MIEIDLTKFWKLLKRKKLLLVIFIFICTFLSIAYCLLAEKIYSTKVVLLPSSLGSEQTSTSIFIPGVSSFLNQGTGSINEDLLTSILNSRTFLSSLRNISVEDQNGNNITIKSFFGFDTLNNKTIPSYIKTIKNSISFSKGKKSDGFHDFEYVLEIMGNDPIFIYHLANKLVPFLDSVWMAYFTAKIDRDIDIILIKLDHTRKSLNESEEQLIDFQEKNFGIGNNITSPILNRKLQELTRDTKVLETKFLLVYDKLQSLELEKLSVSPKMTVLDSAYISTRHVIPRRKLIVGSTFFFSSVLSIVLMFITFLIKENRDSKN